MFFMLFADKIKLTRSLSNERNQIYERSQLQHLRSTMQQLFNILILLPLMINLTVANQDFLSDEFIEEINQNATTWKVCEAKT